MCPEEHHKHTHAGLAESRDTSEPERLERGRTVQPLLQLTLQVRASPLTLILPHSLHCVAGRLHSALKPSDKQFTLAPFLSLSVCKHSKERCRVTALFQTMSDVTFGGCPFLEDLHVCRDVTCWACSGRVMQCLLCSVIIVPCYVAMWKIPDGIAVWAGYLSVCM